ncbi:hypothetical protein CLOM_g4529 [Closterium sp. NIES-68]|nr:hypothetical protein CLOM_g4529 [Closterium sp. NIES-68]
MPFGITNAPATFQAEVNHIVRPLLDECVVVYLDDILIYPKTMDEHIGHLRQVFEILRKEQFYAKLSKSEFVLNQVPFLGYVISARGVHVDPKKFEATSRSSLHTCQRMKSSKQKKLGLLQPLPVPEQPWHTVSLDFITGLPRMAAEHDAIMVVIDKFSKMGPFIATHANATTGETARLYFHRVAYLHGIPGTFILIKMVRYFARGFKQYEG